MISSSIDVNNDGANSRKEAPNDAARSAGRRASSLQLWKIVLGLIAFLVVSWVGNAALMVTAVNNLTKDLKVEDGSLKNTDGGSVSTHNQKTTYSISHDFENNASESRRRLQAGGSVQVAAITCPVVRQAIKSIQDGDNEGVVEMVVGAGFLTASVTANFYHAQVTSGTFGIERIHLDGNLDVAYAVECEEASCNVAGYKCPVLGLAMSDEGRRRLDDDCWGKCESVCRLNPRELALSHSCVTSHPSCRCTGPSQCHPAGSHLTLEDGQSIAIDRAAVGTLVKTNTGFQPILGSLHADEDLVGSYLRFATKSASMTISPGHHTFINGTETDPSFIKLGDLLHTPHGLEPTRIETVEARGAYHIYVKGGNYYVDGILASDYVPLVLQRLSPHGPFGLAPRAVTSLVHAYVEARYSLGIPLIPVGKGFFSSKGIFRLHETSSVPSPLIVALTILIELANAAAAYALGLTSAATLAAAALAVATARRAARK